MLKFVIKKKIQVCVRTLFRKIKKILGTIGLFPANIVVNKDIKSKRKVFTQLVS